MKYQDGLGRKLEAFGHTTFNESKPVLNITSDSNDGAASALYREMNEQIVFPTCKTMAGIVSGLPYEMPMGMSEKKFIKRQKKIAWDRMKATGIVPTGLFTFLARRLLWKAIQLLVEHWIMKKGWA